MCKKTVIAQREEISITQCANCKVVNIWKPGLLLKFSFKQFDDFAKVARQINFDSYVEYAPDGKEIVILSTPFPDMSLMFTRSELSSFTAAMDEALYMQKVYQLVHN